MNPKGIEVLRAVLRRLRWDDQGGYPGLCQDGGWDFVSTSLPQTTPEELNALFDLAGIVPDPIIPLGSCRDCVHLEGGRSSTVPNSCGSCRSPRMTNFVPREKLRRTA